MSDEDTYNLRWNTASEQLSTAVVESMFAVVNGAKAKFGKDGNEYFYIVGDLPEPDCIMGFGKTPYAAMRAFYDAWMYRKQKASYEP